MGKPIRKPDCYHCVHGHFDPGHSGSMWEPPEPSATYCEHPNEWIIEMQAQEGETFALRCPRFRPQRAGKCGHCQQVIHESVLTAPFHGAFMDDAYFCSQACLDAWEQNIRDWESEEAAMEAVFERGDHD